jgi:catechol 2,3-dioxygenase-like lactoylglutathione lyase family enzyme
MTVRLNHTIVTARDRDASALFLTEVLGLPAPMILGRFAVVQLGDTSLDFMSMDDAEGTPLEVSPQHYAFLVSEAEFDEIFGRIRARGLRYWADPHHHEPDRINTWDDGRGVYFDDPNGHVLEILTRPYGSGGTVVARPHPLVMQPLRPAGGNGPIAERPNDRADHRLRPAGAERPDFRGA